MNQVMAALLLFLLAACQQAPQPSADGADAGTVDATVDAAAHVNAIADRYYEHVLATTPEAAYFAGVDPGRHDGIEDNSLEGVARRNAAVDAMLRDLQAVDRDGLPGGGAWITHAYLAQEFASNVALRVCRNELWNVNQMGGWHSDYVQVAGLQPTGTPELRRQSLDRWSQFADVIRNEIDNLETGLQQGYSAPKAVVRRVLEQLDGLLALEAQESPLYSPAARDNDEAFAKATREIVANSIYPALREYRDYLAGQYLAAAREALSVTANPNGRQCYEASLQSYTTLGRSGKDVFELGQATVAANRAAVVDLGRAAYGLEDFESIIDAANDDPSDRFADKDQLLQFSRDAVSRAEGEMPAWVGHMPTQPVAVVPFDAHEEGTGRSAHYRPGTDERPGEYRIPLHEPQEQSRGNAEVTAFHETWPGHHLQFAVGQSVGGLHRVTQIIWFSGPGEGWARYSEALAEEMDLYTTTTAPIIRRAWPARGMVVDPGIHLFGWTREQAVQFMMESGRFTEARANEMVDRIAILPGQLTAYDSGGLEIKALRQLAEDTLREAFDLREFHDRILENGTVPLRQLRTHIEAWLADADD